MKTELLLSCLLLGGAGCMVGPDYEEPPAKAPDAFASGTQEGFRADPALVDWWKEFHDPRLDELIDRAVRNNYSVKTATALLREARALYSQESFNLVPTVTAGAGYTRQLESNALFPNVPRADREFGFWSAGFDAFWELDVFGRIRRSMEAASAEVGQAEASRRDVLLSLLSEVARNYFEYRGARYQVEIARQNARNEDETLQFTIARLDGGRGTELDVARARAQLKSTLALIPPIESDMTRAKNRLAVLLAESPSAFTLQVDQDRPLGVLPKLVAIGKPGELLRRRPDIRQAERRLAASTARIGVATADLYPRIGFSGSFGPQAVTVPALFQAGSASYAFGPTLSWAAFDLGRVAARIRAADAHAEADLFQFQQTVLLALEETENALFQFGRVRSQQDVLVEAVTSGERALTLANARYQGGVADFLSTLDAQRTVLQLQIRLAESETRTFTALIAVYKALGGGWEGIPEAEPQSPESQP